jgi:hypothetical protein
MMSNIASLLCSTPKQLAIGNNEQKRKTMSQSIERKRNNLSFSYF